MNLANLENAREQFRLSGATGFNADRINDYLDELIEQAEAELPVVPTIEVGQVWVNVDDSEWTVEILGIGKRVALCRDHWGGDATISFSTITKHYTLQTTTPEVVEVVEVDGIKVGSQWISKKYNYKYIVESVDASNNRVNWKSGGFDHLDTLRDYYKEVVALTADDVSDGVLDAYENRWRHTTHRDAIAAAITAYLAEKEKESGNG